MRTSLAIVVSTLSLATGAMARPGPDVTLLDIQTTTNHGLVGAVRAYSIGSHTCNIGNQNLLWLSSGSPGLAMNGYRLYDQRLTQVGMSWVKTACCAGAQSNPGCGACNGVGSNLLGAGCLDVYSSSWNSQQNRLAPRWAINGFSGAFQSFSGNSGDAVFKRLQIAQSDLVATNFPGALYFLEGVYVGSDDATNGNAFNNATYRRVTVDQSTFNFVLQGSAQTRIPAIVAWRDHGMGAGIPDPDVTLGQLDIPAEGRFWYGFKARDMGNGLWRYDYAVFNLNSDLSGGSFSVPVPANVTVTDIGFNAPRSHSGDINNNDPWQGVRSADSVTWTSAQTFAQNPNSNAIRWGTMFNFWFTANAAHTTASASLGTFKPYTPSSFAIQVKAPSGTVPCYANCDGSSAQPILNVNDYQCFLNKFASEDPTANCDNSSLPPVLNVNDFACFMNAYAVGCP